MRCYHTYHFVIGGQRNKE